MCNIKQEWQPDLLHMLAGWTSSLHPALKESTVLTCVYPSPVPSTIGPVWLAAAAVFACLMACCVAASCAADSFLLTVPPGKPFPLLSFALITENSPVPFVACICT